LSLQHNFTFKRRSRSRSQVKQDRDRFDFFYLAIALAFREGRTASMLLSVKKIGFSHPYCLIVVKTISVPNCLFVK